MSRIVFDQARPVVESDPARNDVACFVGLARATGTALPPAVQTWLQTHGWSDGLSSSLAANVQVGDIQVVLATPFPTGDLAFISIDSEVMNVTGVDPTGTVLGVVRGARGTSAAAHTAGTAVLGSIRPSARPICPPFSDLPLPIESYATFTALFDPGGSPESWGTDYLAAAVRSFFAQGGRRCYVVRMDDPVSPADASAQNGTTGAARKLQELLPGYLYASNDRRTWHGVGHLGGLPDVSFLALPDLPVLSASGPVAAAGSEPAPAAAPAQFMECAAVEATPPPPPMYLLPAPRLSSGDFAGWAQSVQTVLGFLSQNNIREIQLVAAFPLPSDPDAALAAEDPSSAELAQDVHDYIGEYLNENVPSSDPGLSTAFLQLAYPWLTTSGSFVLNESLEPPDGALVGILARNVLTRGAFTSATKIVPAEISDVSPYLPAQDLQTPTAPLTWGDNSFKPLIVRLSLFGFTPAGLRLLSDVTAYPGEAYRPACVHRLVSVISRAARQLGEGIVFQQNGPALWKIIEDTLGRLMTRLWQANALDGDTAQDAFSVRCDSSTMTQNDLDNGRLIALVTFSAAATVELIRVTLAIETSGASAQGIAVMAEAS